MKKNYSVKLGSGKVINLTANSLAEIEMLVAMDMPEEYYGMSITCKDAPEFLLIPVKEYFENEAMFYGAKIPTPMEMAMRQIRLTTGCYKVTYDEEGEVHSSITLGEAIERNIVK